MFSENNPKTFAKTLHRLVKNQSLVHASRGVYVNPHARSFDPRVVIEEVAQALRPGEYNYISLESMLSEYGAISQVPVDRITVMTTGRRGTYKTPYGVIEFTHTARPTSEVLAHIKQVEGRPLRIATREAAWRDLKRVGRNVNMVDLEMLREDDE